MDIKNAENRSIPIDDLFLDPENPRFLHLELKGQAKLDQATMIDEIRKDSATIKLSKAIGREGVLNPVVVQERPDGSYLLIDGNRRTVTLKVLNEEAATPPPGITFDTIPARIIPSTTSAADVEIMKGVLQEGQKSWGRFNDAAYTRRLRYQYKMEEEDIADRLQLSVKKVKERLRDFDTYVNYTKHTGDTDDDRFSYFADAPAKVRKWFEETDDNLEDYFELIAPGSDRHKIRSVSTSGGLRDFAKVIEDKEALDLFLSDPRVNIEAALEIAHENNLQLAAPFLKQLGTWATKLAGLNDTQLAMVKHEPKVKLELKQLRNAADEVIEKLS